MPIDRIDDDGAALLDAGETELNRADSAARSSETASTAQRGEQDAEADYRGQIEAINRSQMMIEFAMDGTILRGNDNYLRAFGYTEAEIKGKNHSIFVTEEHSQSSAYAEFWNDLRDGVYRSGLFQRIDKLGKEVWIEASYNPVLGADHKPVKVIKFAANLTDRVHIQNRLEDTEARLQAILNSVADGIVTIDGAGTIVSLNPAASRMFEYKEAEAAGKNIKMLMPEPDRSAHDGHLARHQSTGESKVIGVGRELEGLSKTGRTFPMELTVTETSLRGQKFFVGVVRDMSERSLREKALRKSEEFLDRSGRLALIGGWELNLLTLEVSWSDETRRLHGFENDYVPTLEEGISFYAPEARPVIRAAVERSLSEGKDWEVVVPVIRVDGSRIWARVTATVQFANGKPVRLVGAFQDVTARVTEQNALKEANQRTALATESCGIGIWDWDISTGKFACDAYIYRLFGLEPECDERRDLEFWVGRVHSEDRAAVESGLRDCIAGIKPYDIEFRNVWDDGSIHHIRATGKAIRDQNGNATRMVGTNVEITAAKLAYEALRRSTENEQLVLKGVKDYAILMLSPEGLVSTWNEGAEKIKGYRAEEIVGGHFSKFFTPEDIAAGLPARELQRAAEVGRSESEGWRVRKDGSRFWAQMTLSALRDENGQLRGFAKVTRDITERMLAEEAMRDLASLLNLSHDSIIVRELDGTIRFWNRGAEEMYGYNKQQAVGHISHELLRTVSPEGPEAIEAYLVEHGHWEGELRHSIRDGPPILVESRWVVQPSLNGAPPRVMETNNDITERRQAEEKLVRYTHALERSNLELDAFAYAASHDLKAPLRVIHNTSMWIEEDLAGKLTAEMSENMNLLRSRVQRMDRLLDDLLEYSRIGRETDDSHTEAISGAVLMENIQGLISPPEGFIVDATTSLAGIEVFRMPLQQILINLISNAIKHHDKKAGRIEVSVEDLGADWRFSVKDDGPGIAPQYHEKIFKMFQTLKPRDQVEGSGMGLAMVRKHVDVAGGELKLESTVGQGSTFSFTWPKDNGKTNKTKHKFARIGER